MTGWIRWAPIAVIALLVAAFAIALFSPDDQDAANDPRIGKPLPELPLQPAFAGTARFDPQRVEGPYLLNVWASWCAPCRIEHPILMALAEDGVPIYGVVYKDEPADARAFLTKLGDPFAGLAADPEGRAGLELGLTGAPETFVVDANGVVRARWRGPITETVWERRLEPAWAEARDAALEARETAA